MNPPVTHLDLLERPLFAHLATVSSSGAPLVHPMWFLFEGEEGVIKLTHTNVRHNYRHLRREPRVALSIAEPGREYRYLQVRGVVESMEPDPTGAFFRVLHQRYRGADTEVPDRDVRVVVTIRPTAFKAR